jgi:hypothetical protein
MRMVNVKALRNVLCTVAAFAVGLTIMSCDDSSSPTAPSTHTLSGTLTKSGAANGVYAYLKLVVSTGTSSSPALYWTRSTAFSSGTASYTITGISAGTYMGFSFLDVNGNSPNSTSASPDAGDYATQSGQALAITADQVSNIPDVAWVLVQ